MKAYFAVLAVTVLSCVADGTNQVPSPVEPASPAAVKLQRPQGTLAGQPKTNHFEDLDPLQVFKAQPMDRDAFKKAQEEYLKNKQMEKQGDFWHWGELQRLLPAPKKMVPSERWKCNMG